MHEAVASSRRLIPSLQSQLAIIALATGFGLLASYPSWFLLALGAAGVVVLAYVGELALLTIVLLLSGVSFNFLGDYADTSALNFDGFRLVLVIGAFAIAVLRRPALLAPAANLKMYWVLLLYAGVSLAWSPSPPDGARFWFKLLYPLVAYLLTWQVLLRYGERIVILLLGLSVVCETVWNVGIWASGLSPYSGIGYAGRFVGASHPNTIGLFCAAAALMLYAIAIPLRGWKWSALLLVSVVEMCATGSRTALISAGAGLSTFELLSGRLKRLLWVALVGACIWTFLPTFGERTAAGGADAGLAPSEIGSGLNFSGRLVLWGDAWAGLMGDGQVLGKGLGATDLFFSTRYVGLKSIHSGYLLVMIDLGFLGLALVLAFYVPRLIRSARAALRRSATSRTNAMSAGLLAMFLIASLTESTFAGYAFPGVLLWIGMAMGECPHAKAIT